MNNKNSQRWNFHKDIHFENCGEDICRKILSYAEDLMCVENHFETCAVGALHTHPHTQISYVVSGRFTYHVDGEEKIIQTGDSVLVQGNLVHGLTCLEKGIVLDIFTPMRKDFL